MFEDGGPEAYEQDFGEAIGVSPGEAEWDLGLH